MSWRKLQRVNPRNLQKEGFHSPEAPQELVCKALGFNWTYPPCSLLSCLPASRWLPPIPPPTNVMLFSKVRQCGHLSKFLSTWIIHCWGNGKWFLLNGPHRLPFSWADSCHLWTSPLPSQTAFLFLLSPSSNPCPSLESSFYRTHLCKKICYQSIVDLQC